MRLPVPAVRYDVSLEAQRNALLEQADTMNHKKGVDLELVNERLILRSPNGTRYAVTVTDLGVLEATAI